MNSNYDEHKVIYTKIHYNQIVKYPKDKYLETIKRNETCQANGAIIRLSADLSAETLLHKREWEDIFKVLKGKNCQSRKLFLEKPSFKKEG